MEKKYNLNLRPGMDFFIEKNHWLPKLLKVEYVAFGKKLYSAGPGTTIPRHEFLHIAQFEKFGVPIVIWHYLYHFFKNLFQLKKIPDAYAAIPFEIEARVYQKRGINHENESF